MELVKIEINRSNDWSLAPANSLSGEGFLEAKEAYTEVVTVGLVRAPILPLIILPLEVRFGSSRPLLCSGSFPHFWRLVAIK